MAAYIVFLNVPVKAVLDFPSPLPHRDGLGRSLGHGGAEAEQQRRGSLHGTRVLSFSHFSLFFFLLPKRALPLSVFFFQLCGVPLHVHNEREWGCERCCVTFARRACPSDGCGEPSFARVRGYYATAGTRSVGLFVSVHAWFLNTRD